MVHHSRHYLIDERSIKVADDSALRSARDGIAKTYLSLVNHMLSLVLGSEASLPVPQTITLKA